MGILTWIIHESSLLQGLGWVGVRHGTRSCGFPPQVSHNEADAVRSARRMVKDADIKCGTIKGNIPYNLLEYIYSILQKLMNIKGVVGRFHE